MMQAREACLLRGPMGRLGPPAPERVIRDSTHIQTRARGTNYKKMENLKTPICLCVCGYHLLALQHKCMLLENTEPFITAITSNYIEDADSLVLCINGDADPTELESVLSQDSDVSSDEDSESLIGYISSGEVSEAMSVISLDSDDLERIEVVDLDVPDPTLAGDDVLYYEYDPATEFSDIVSMNDENIMDISLDKLQDCHRIRCLRAPCSDSTH